MNDRKCMKIVIYYRKYLSKAFRDRIYGQIVINDFELNANCDLWQLLARRGIRLKESQKTWKLISRQKFAKKNLLIWVWNESERHLSWLESTRLMSCHTLSDKWIQFGRKPVYICVYGDRTHRQTFASNLWCLISRTEIRLLLCEHFKYWWIKMKEISSSLRYQFSRI